ncbi:hypothetical protein PUN4_700023 [Paraburkholderia unamae]|nr:hypothetical protein PUN4_700023 [Paraburkholderia unamae]
MGDDRRRLGGNMGAAGRSRALSRAGRRCRRDGGALRGDAAHRDRGRADRRRHLGSRRRARPVGSAEGSGHQVRERIEGGRLPVDRPRHAGRYRAGALNTRQRRATRKRSFRARALGNLNPLFCAPILLEIDHEQDYQVLSFRHGRQPVRAGCLNARRVGPNHRGLARRARPEPCGIRDGRHRARSGARAARCWTHLAALAGLFRPPR